MFQSTLTPVQFNHAKRTASWVAENRFNADGGYCTILMVRTHSDHEDSVYAVMTISDTLRVCSQRPGLSYAAAIDAVAEQMKEEFSY